MENLIRCCMEDFTELIYYNPNVVHKRELRSLLGRIRYQRGCDVHIIEAVPILEILLEKPFYIKEEKNHEFYVVYDPSLKEEKPVYSSYVYFISSSDGYVKIGLSSNPEARLKSLQTATHHLLQLVHVIPGNENIEKYLHRLFVSDHVRGEWFKFSEVIMDFIEFNFVSNKKEVPSRLEAFFE